MGWPRRLATAILVVALLGVASPLVVRGPLLRWAWARTFASRCGHFSIGGGHFGWATLMQWALGRPFSVVLERVVITDPEDRSVLEAGRVEAKVSVEFSPLRIDVHAARVAHGVWRWVSAEGRGIGDPFRAIPAAGRGACLAPRKESEPRPGLPVPIRVEEARLEDLDVDLDFPAWRLTLSRVTSDVWLSLDPALRFKFAHAVVAGGGKLRIGPVGAPWTTTTPFDTIVFDSLCTVPETPSDLALVLDSAQTGRANLSGRAVFHQVFPGASPRPRRAGLDVEARWRWFGEGLSRSQAAWLSHREWLKHIDHDLQLGIHGPYDEPSVTASVDAAGARVEAELAQGVANLKMDLRGVDTSPWFEPVLRGLLGGRLQGRLLASLRLAPTFAGLAAEVLNADLRLEREATTRGPRSLVLRIGYLQAAHSPSGLLSASIHQLRLVDGRLQLLGARATWSRLSARAEASLGLNPSDWMGSRLEARGTLAMASMADWIPARIAQGRLDLVGKVSGTLASLRLQTHIAPKSTLILGGQRLRLPDRLTLEWGASSGLHVPRILLRTETGFLGLGGRLVPDGRIEAEVLLSHYPLAELPWFPSGPVARSFGAVLTGRLLVEGPVAEPWLRGTIKTHSLDFRGRSLGAATATLVAGEAGGHGDVRVGPSLAAKVNLRYAPLSFGAEISLRKQSLQPWLPRAFSVPTVAASGTVHVDYGENQILTGVAALEVEGPGLADVKVAARAQAEAMTADIAGEIALPLWRFFWSPYVTEAQGTIGFHVTARRDRDGTRLSGDMLAVRDLSFRLRHRYGSIRLMAGDRLSFDGRSLSSQGLRIELPWFHGQVVGRMTLDPFDLSQSLINAGVAGVFELGALPASLWPPLTLGGQAVVDATVTGSLGPTPGPQIHGQVDLEQVRVKLPDLPAVVIDGRVQAREDRFSTHALDLHIDHMGRLTVGTLASPASAVLLSLLPLRFGEVDAGFSGHDLVLGSAHSPLEIRDLDVNGRLHGPPGARTLSGLVDVSRGSLRPSRAKTAPEARRRPWYQSLPPGLTIDLGIRGLNHAMEIGLPVVPDVTADFDCRLHATRQGAHWSGRVFGAGLYDRMAFRLYSWFGDKGLLHCQLETKE